MIQKDRFPLRWYFFFNADWPNTKSGKSKLSLLPFRLAIIMYLLCDVVSQRLQSSLSSPNLHYLKQFPQKEGHKKKYPSYKCRHCSMGSQTTNSRESSFFCDACPENPALCIEPCFKLYKEAIKNLVTKYWFMYNVYDNDPYEKWFDWLQNIDLCITYIITLWS